MVRESTAANLTTRVSRFGGGWTVLATTFVQFIAAGEGCSPRMAIVPYTGGTESVPPSVPARQRPLEIMERGKGICAVTSFVAASVAIFGVGGAAGDAAPMRPATPAGAPAFARATERAWPAPAHVSAPPFAH